MKIEIENTGLITKIDGINARIWKGKTESGINIMCCITSIGIDNNETEENRELLIAEMRRGYLMV